MQLHANAPWTPLRRRQLIPQIDTSRLTVTDVAELGGISERTVFKWLARWRDGDQLLEDRSSIARSLPHATAPAVVATIEQLRRQRWTVPAIGDGLRMPYSTVTAVCRRLGLNRLSKLDPVEPPNRYQRRHAGDLIHVDVKKLGRFDQPGHRIHGDRRRNTPRAGWEYLHVAVDDATRLAYAEVLNEGETAETTAAFLERAVAWFAAQGVRVRRVMTDNGPGYRSRDHVRVCRNLGLKHLRTRPYRPRTNGKAERFIRLITNSWAYGVTYQTSQHRRHALPAWLHYYNQHRPHGSLDRATPRQRLHQLNNPAGIYS